MEMYVVIPWLDTAIDESYQPQGLKHKYTEDP